MAGQTAPCVAGKDGHLAAPTARPVPGGGNLSERNPCGTSGSPRMEVPCRPPPVPAPRGRTLLEAEMGHPLDGRASLLHELVEADQEGLLLLLLLLPLPACLGG